MCFPRCREYAQSYQVGTKSSPVIFTFQASNVRAIVVRSDVESRASGTRRLAPMAGHLVGIASIDRLRAPTIAICGAVSAGCPQCVIRREMVNPYARL